jgi:hypothetical protein
VKRLPLVLAASVLLATPESAHALSGLYLSLGVGYGHFTGDQLVVNEQDGPNDQPDYNSETCCPGHGLAAQFRLGFSIFGFAAPEFGIVGDGFGVGSNEQGGAGFVGGGVRIFPIHFFSLIGLDDESLPIDAGIGVLFGWSIAGKDFAYTGTFWDVDFHLDFKLASFFSLGVKLDVIIPKYSAFVYTDYKNDRGRCSDSGTQIDTMSPTIDKRDANCVGDGPSTTLLSPQVYLTFHFDPLSGD